MHRLFYQVISQPPCIWTSLIKILLHIKE